jgi:hypothetical protein
MPIDFNDPKIQEQIPINQAIAEALIEAIPEAWKAAELTLEWSDQDAGMTQSLCCPESDEEALVPYEITKATCELDAHRDKFALGWRQAKFTVRRNAQSHWDVNAEFVMPEVP